MKKKSFNGYSIGSGAYYHFPDKYEKTTYQGFPIRNTFRSKNGRKYVVIERAKGINGRLNSDFVVGNGYNSFDGTWAQGYYDFPDRKSAVKFARKNAYRK